MSRENIMDVIVGIFIFVGAFVIATLAYVAMKDLALKERKVAAIERAVDKGISIDLGLGE